MYTMIIKESSPSKTLPQKLPKSPILVKSIPLNSVYKGDTFKIISCCWTGTCMFCLRPCCCDEDLYSKEVP